MKAIAAILLAVAAAAPSPSPEIRYFQYQRTIQLPQATSGQTCVVLDPLTFQHSSGSLNDLRIYRDSAPVPYVLLDESAVPSATTPPPITPLNSGTKDGKTVFDAEMPEGIYTDVELSITGSDFLAAVTVFGGPTPQEAKTRIGTWNIFDFTRQKLGRSTVLHLPKSSFHALHFEIAGPVKPEQITGITPLREALIEPKYIAVAEVSQTAQQGRSTILKATTPPRVPVQRIVFEPAPHPVNFSRGVEVTVTGISERNANPDNLPVQSFGSLLRIHDQQEGRKIDEERLSIGAPYVLSDRPQQWTVTIANGDDTPIEFSRVRLEMRERDVCFEAAAGAAYTLYYGDAALAAPSYDFATWFVHKADFVPATLSPEAKNASYQPRPDSRPLTEKYPWLIWVALIAVVLLLALIAFNSAKRVRKPDAMP